MYSQLHSISGGRLLRPQTEDVQCCGEKWPNYHCKLKVFLIIYFSLDLASINLYSDSSVWSTHFALHNVVSTIAGANFYLLWNSTQLQRISYDVISWRVCCMPQNRSQQVTNTGRSCYRYRQRVCWFRSWKPINMESVAIPGISVSATLHSFPWPLYRFAFIVTEIVRKRNASIRIPVILWNSPNCPDFQWLWHVLSFIMSSNFRIFVGFLFLVYFPTICQLQSQHGMRGCLCVTNYQGSERKRQWSLIGTE
jgi:hypothetical protein